MEEVTNITENTVNRYFNSLSKLGYRNYTDVYKIIILTFLEELLDYDFFGFVSKYTIIGSIARELNCTGVICQAIDSLHDCIIVFFRNESKEIII